METTGRVRDAVVAKVCTNCTTGEPPIARLTTLHGDILELCFTCHTQNRLAWWAHPEDQIEVLTIERL